MPMLKFKSRYANEVEQIAREHAEQRTKLQEASLLRSDQDARPKMAEELLGIWVVVEESFYSKSPYVVSSIEFENFHFESMGMDGTVEGIVTSQGKNMFQGRHRKGSFASGRKCFDLKGRVISPGLVRIQMIPAFPWHQAHCTLLAGMFLAEMKWNGYEMVRYERAMKDGTILRIRAVKAV